MSYAVTRYKLITTVGDLLGDRMWKDDYVPGCTQFTWEILM